MTTKTAKSLVLLESYMIPIRKQVLDAIRVMFDRAVEDAPDEPDIQDRKQDVADSTLSNSGALQDCEFGMILLLVHDWLGGDFFVSIDRQKFARAVVALVERTVNRVLARRQNYGGGRGNYAAFFTGEPYTQYARGKKYSANLDAAMITLAFLAPAIEKFNNVLAQRECRVENVAFPDWVKSLRDAALYVVLEGLEYAQECCVINNNEFQGFTCDPESNIASPKDGSLTSDYDRLFFTWTACETISDMVVWRNSYLTKQVLDPLPRVAIEALKSAIAELEKTLVEAAAWCQARFLPEFEDFEPEDPTDLVQEVDRLAINMAIDPDLHGPRIFSLERSVQYVYHLSQYAAIRSLVPRSVQLEEARAIIDKLERLVSVSIIESGLDGAKHPALFNTLTRKYRLGKSGPEDYTDDAWYPLVVRSLSGLLSRTLSEIGKNFSRSEVFSLTQTFKRSLDGHFRKLTKRRPAGGRFGPNGDLWSFAEGQPYVLYATQRTIFSLIKYADFLKAVDDFLRTAPDARGPEEQKLADDIERDIRSSRTGYDTSAETAEQASFRGRSTFGSEIFISYCHKDVTWLEDLKTHLAPFLDKWNVKINAKTWDDREIRAGDEWQKGIESALDRAVAAILLVTHHYLASDFIINKELPKLVTRVANKGLRLSWISVRPSAWDQTLIGDYQCLNNNPYVTLAELEETQKDKAMVEICRKIKTLFTI